MIRTNAFRCRAILFDLDGVLVDSAECVERTWRQWAIRHRLDPEDVIEAAHGRRTVETLQLIAPQLNTDLEAASLEAKEAITAEGIREVWGARDILAPLPTATWAVVTSGTRAVAEFRIALTGLPAPSVMICAEDISRGKPDPEGYLAAAAQLGQSADSCIVIEDAPAGIEAAKNGGMRVIAIASTFPADRLREADAIVDRLADLTIAYEGGQIAIDVEIQQLPTQRE